MPLYCYQCPKCGAYYEERLSMSECDTPTFCPECRAPGDRDYEREWGGRRDLAGNWPMESDAAGVNPKQRQEAMQAASDLGVPTQFNEDGNPVFTSRKHRKEYLTAIKMHDRDGGYGDP